MQVNYKRLSLFLVFTCILLSSSLTYVVLSQGTNIPTITSGPYAGAPSYTIYKEGSTYYAKNAYGNNDYSGTNVGPVVNNVIIALNGIKGTIHFLSGFFTLTGYQFETYGVDVNSITFEGEGFSTIIFSGDSTIFRINGDPSGYNKITIKDMYLLGGNAYVTNGIYANNIDEITVDNLKVDGFTRGAIRIENSTRATVKNCMIYNSKGYDGIFLYGCSFSTIEHNDLYNCGQAGILVDDCHNIKILSNTADTIGNVSIGSRLDGILVARSYQITIDDNTCILSAADGIAIERCKHVTITNNHLIRNHGRGIMMTRVSNLGEYGDSWNNIITNNDIRNNYMEGIWLNETSNAIISNNQVIENDYDVTGNYDGISINYGTGNQLIGDICVANGRNEIYIGVGCLKTTMIGVDTNGSPHIVGINDDGTDTHITSSWNSTVWIDTYP